VHEKFERNNDINTKSTTFYHQCGEKKLNKIFPHATKNVSHPRRQGEFIVTRVGSQEFCFAARKIREKLGKSQQKHHFDEH
jgi:hypothetical protein